MYFVKLNAESQPAEWPVTFDRVRVDNPNTSFPKDPTNLDLSSYDFEPFAFSDKPDFDDYLQNIVEVAPVLTDGVWVQSWSVTEKYSESAKTQKISERDAANLEKKKSLERSKRNNLLGETDHYGLSDVSMTEAMTAYRQALRDVPQQEGFPQTITWPTKPE